MAIEIKDLYLAFRAYEEHENLLINQRTTWLVTVQSVLIATFGFSFQKYYEVSEKILEAQKQNVKIDMGDVNEKYVTVLKTLYYIGIFTSVIALIAVGTAVVAQGRLRKLWRTKHAANATVEGLPDIAGGGSGFAQIFGGAFALALPVFFVLMWYYIDFVAKRNFNISFNVSF
jgi:hypothetical protein